MAKKRGKKRSMRGFLGNINREIDKCVGEKPECILQVLDAASDAAHQTASHLRHAWQDESSAKAWDRIARHIDVTHGKVKKELPF